MRLLLTDRFCDRAKPGKEPQTDYFDETVPGLALRVGRSKSWTLHYSRNGKRARLTFGTYPTLSLAAARTRALEAKADIDAGHDPRSAKQDTLRAICEEYLKREGDSLRTTQWRRQQLERLVYPSLGDRPITEIKRSEVVRLLDGIEDGSGPVMADRTLAIIRRVMNWHASRSDEFRSPIVRGMARSKNQARSRTLSDDELRLVWKAQSPIAPMARFILLTAARRSEVSGMTWAEIDKGDWILPAARNKTKVDLVRPLSSTALSVLKEAIETSHGAREGSIFKLHPSTALDRLRAEVGFNDFTLHDLRRTSRSLMSRAGINADIAERCLGHVIPGVRGVYDRHEYHREKALAFEALASLILRIVQGTAEVVPIKGRKR
jgi:integrase